LSPQKREKGGRRRVRGEKGGEKREDRRVAAPFFVVPVKNIYFLVPRGMLRSWRGRKGGERREKRSH